MNRVTKRLEFRQGRMDDSVNHRRIHQGNIRAIEIDGQPGVRLKVVRYNVVDDFGSVWARGSVLDGLNERLPQLARQHDRSVIIGRAVPGFQDDGDGQIVDFRFANFDRVPAANEAHSLIEDGIIDECSIGFRMEYEFHEPNELEREQWPGVREVITRAFVSEVSLVMEGAVPGARVLAVREKPIKIIELEKRAPQLISVEDAARIYSAAIQKMQSGADGTDVLLAGLQDIKSSVVDDEPDAEPDKTEQEPEPQTEVEPSTESPDETEPEKTEGETPVVTAQDELEDEKETLEESTDDDDDDIETADEEVEAFLAELDDLMADRDDVWVPDTAAEQVTG